MRQITDKNGNVLAEPYLTMANENFNPNFSSLFGEYMSIDYAFDWSKSSRGKLFWEAVYQGLLPVISVIRPNCSSPYRPQPPRVWHLRPA